MSCSVNIYIRVSKLDDCPQFLKVIKKVIPSINDNDENTFLKIGCFSKDGISGCQDDAEELIAGILNGFVYLERDSDFYVECSEYDHSGGGEKYITANYKAGETFIDSRSACCWDCACPDCEEEGEDVSNMVCFHEFDPDSTYKCEACGKEYSGEEILEWNDVDYIRRFKGAFAEAMKESELELYNDERLKNDFD